MGSRQGALGCDLVDATQPPRLSMRFCRGCLCKGGRDLDNAAIGPDAARRLLGDVGQGPQGVSGALAGAELRHLPEEHQHRDDRGCPAVGRHRAAALPQRLREQRGRRLDFWGPWLVSALLARPWRPYAHTDRPFRPAFAPEVGLQPVLGDRSTALGFGGYRLRSANDGGWYA